MTRAFIGVLVTLALGAGCTAEDDDDVTVARRFPIARQSAGTATAWFDLELQLVKQTPGFSPPVASRAFGFTGVTLYEAVVNGIPWNRSLAGALTDMPPMPEPTHGKSYYWPAAANAALASITRQLFATTTAANLAAIDALEAALNRSYLDEVDQTVIDRSADYGRAVADAIFAWSLTDGGHEGYLHNFPTSYVPPTGPGMWVPTPPAYLRAMQPYWGDNRPFMDGILAECDLDKRPPPYSVAPGSEFYNQAREVYETNLNLTAEQIEIARFWSDDPVATATPPGHTISILTQVLEQQEATLDVAAEAYAKVGIAVSDAFLSCWADKYRFNLLRPVTYIDSVVDAHWMPLLVTPPFPEYASGHSTQSGAGEVVLTDMFGTFAFTDHTHDARGLPPRSFDSFEAAAEEAAISRLYGGIHYRAAIEDGLVMGRCVGAAVNRLPFHK